MFNRIFTKSIIISEGGWVVSKLTSEPPKIFQYYIFGHKFSFCEEKIQFFFSFIMLYRALRQKEVNVA